jgi:hypothetical protein
MRVQSQVGSAFARIHKPDFDHDHGLWRAVGVDLRLCGGGACFLRTSRGFRAVGWAGVRVCADRGSTPTPLGRQDEQVKLLHHDKYREDGHDRQSE